MNTDATTGRLRSLVADHPDRVLPPSRVDLTRVLEVGRRRRRVRAVAATGAVVAVVATVLVAVVSAVAAVDREDKVRPAISNVTPAPTRVVCRVEPLHSPWPGIPTVVMDPTGRYLAGYVDESEGGKRHAVLWTTGAFTELKLPLVAPTPVAVNSRGMVAGRAQQNRKNAGWLLHDGQLVELRPPAGADDVIVNGMNARGDVAGYATYSDDRWAAVVWWFGSSRATLLSKAGNGVAFAIDDDGVAYGTLGDGDQPAYWPKGQPAQSLADPDGARVGKVFTVAGRWAIGVGAAGDQGVARWVVWDLETRSSRWTASLGIGQVDAVNAQGWLAGSTETFANMKARRPAIRRDGATQVLPPLNDDQAAGTADGISADGHTVTGTYDRGLFDPTAGGSAPETRVIWHC